MINMDMIPGLHVYSLGDPPSLIYAGASFREMTGYVSGDFAECIHPRDRARYAAFMASLPSLAGRRSIEFRVCNSGGVRHMQCELTAAPGSASAVGVITDITAIRRENEALHRINETVPCGIIKYTCSASPRVTYVNEQMLRILRYDPAVPGAADMLRQYKDNIYLMIPPEERERFRRFLDLVYNGNKPTAGEITAFRFDGSRVRLYGWISRSVNAEGEDEYQSVCMDCTERYERKRLAEEQLYLRALSQVYDEIFELDFTRNSGRFVQGRYAQGMGSMASMPMMLDDTVHFWIDNVVCAEDRPLLNGLFAELRRRDADGVESARPLQAEFRARRKSGGTNSYMGIFLKTGRSRYLFCCRNITPQQDARRLQQENVSLRTFTEHMQELVMSFTDGMLAFEISGSRVRPLYYSENVCRFFGYGRDEWMAMMDSMTPIQEFVSRCHITYETFLELLEGSESEFRINDFITGEPKRFRAIRTRADDGSSCYVMLYDVTAADRGTPAAPHQVQIRTFGYFDVFVDGKPIAFRNEKAKELCALLVDRRGGFVTSGEALSVLWEDEPSTPVTQARYRKVALRLKNTLEEYGAGGIIESIDGKRRIVPENVDCDLYGYLAGAPRYAQAFKGSYLMNYSWAESTLAELEG